jgi:hypothetical protein
MKHKQILPSLLSLAAGMCLIAGLTLLNTAPAAASPQPQAYYQTPTPGADGRILYVVKEGDTCLGISLLTGVDMKTLLTLNQMDSECTVIPGNKLLLGVVTAPTSTPGPTETPTPSMPTPTPFNGSGQVCVLLFEDLNGNSIPDTGEAQIAGGAVSITDRLGKYSKTDSTKSGDTFLCFADLVDGDYNISVAPPQGYNATTSMNVPIKVKPGDSFTVNFGAQVSAAQAGPGGDARSSQNSPILAILGGVLVLGGAGLAFYVWRLKQGAAG